MATGQILQDAKIYLSQYDISGDANQINLQTPYDILDGTAFGATSRRRQVGLDAINCDINGFTAFGSTAIDKILSGLNGQGSLPLTIVPEGATENSTALFCKSTMTKYHMGSEVGQLHQFQTSFKGDGEALISGFLAGVGAKTATGTGTGKQQGAITSAQYLYAILHIMSPVAGSSPTLDVIIESDDNSGFTTPTTRLTFAQQVAVGSVYATRIVGPVTDTYWRAKWTIGGTGSPSFPLAVAMGIF